MADGGLAERRSIDYIPLRERHGRVKDLFPVWFAGGAHLATVATGVVGIATGGNLVWTAIAVVFGCAFGTFFMAFHSTQGPQLGLPQMVQSRPQFGYVGALLVWLVALVTYIGYSAFNQVLIASTARQIGHVPTWVTYLLCGILGVVLSVVGYDLVHRICRWSSSLMTLLLVAFTIGILIVHPFTAAQLDLGAFKLAPFLAQFIVAAVYQVSWSIYVSDYSRYLPPNVGVKSSFWCTYIGAFTGGAWMMLVGTVVAGVSGSSDTVTAVITACNKIFPGFGVIVMIVSGVPLMFNSMTYYGGSLTLLSSIDSIKKIKPTLTKRVVSLIIVSGIATLLAFGSSDDFLTEFQNFLTVLGYLFTPWTAINLVDFYLVRRTHYSIREIFNPRGLYRRWNWRGLTAYGVGFATMMPFAIVGDWQAPVASAMNGLDLTMPIGLVVGAGLYWLLCRSMDMDAERKLVARADAGLEDDPEFGGPPAGAPVGAAAEAG